MPKFGKSSQEKLNTVTEILQDLANEVIKYYDISITCGRRTVEEQNILYKTGKSTVKGDSEKAMHVRTDKDGLALAFDFVPYVKGRGQVWSTNEAYFMSGKIIAIADMKFGQGIIISGSDWDNDNDVNDQKFVDCFHIQVSKKGLEYIKTYKKKL